MSFTINIQKNNSEKNRVNKDVETLLTLRGTLKDGTSILDPVIMIEADMDVLAYANYLTIMVFGRSYFITDIKSIRNGLIEISAHVDVLSSFRGEILYNKAIIMRNENKWNLYLDDGVFKSYQNPVIITKTFSRGFDTYEYVLAVAGS